MNAASARSRPKWSRGHVALIAGPVLATAVACSGGSDKPARPSGSPPALSPGVAPPSRVIQSQPMAHVNSKPRIDLLAVERGAAGTVSVRLRMVNQGQEVIEVASAFEDASKDVAFDASAVTLVDGGASKRYFPLRDARGKCVCTAFGVTTLEPGKTLDIYAVLPAPPAALRRITVQVPLTPPFTDIPIGPGPARPAPGQQIGPGSATLSRPDVRPLTSTAEGSESAVDEDDTNQSVRLSTDVLFALNKAELTPRAKAVLEGVAKRIDASTGSTVKVDGHTDNSGDDAINEPLSRRRADAVRSALRGLASRQGISYQAAGHGSKQPVADNASAEGRRLNRRVTVTFTRPPPQPSVQPSTTPSPRWAGGPLPAVATAAPKAPVPAKVKVELNGLHRESGGLATLVWTVTNEGDEDWAGIFARTDLPGYRVIGVEGAALYDGAARLRYRSLHDLPGLCLCTQFGTMSATPMISAKERVTYFNTYKPAPGLKSVDVEIPGFTPVRGVAIR